MFKNFLKFFIVVISLSFLGASCSKVSFRGHNATSSGSFLKGIVNPVKDSFEKAKKGASDVIYNAGDNFAKHLSSEQKAVVDDWLRRNQLNEYGDPIGTLYAGGSPLFNEKTGETTDRYEYLFTRFPQLREIVLSEMKK